MPSEENLDSLRRQAGWSEEEIQQGYRNRPTTEDVPLEDNPQVEDNPKDYISGRPEGMDWEQFRSEGAPRSEREEDQAVNRARWNESERKISALEDEVYKTKIATKPTEMSEAERAQVELNKSLAFKNKATGTASVISSLRGGTRINVKTGGTTPGLKGTYGAMKQLLPSVNKESAKQYLGDKNIATPVRTASPMPSRIPVGGNKELNAPPTGMRALSATKMSAAGASLLNPNLSGLRNASVFSGLKAGLMFRPPQIGVKPEVKSAPKVTINPTYLGQVGQATQSGQVGQVTLKPGEQVIEQWPNDVWFIRLPEGIWTQGQEVVVTRMTNGTYNFRGIDPSDGQQLSRLVGKTYPSVNKVYGPKRGK